jgi:tRNA(fMet)-specific endonuclease VapC
MIHLLDTNTCIRYLNNSHAKVVARLSALPPAEVRLCSVVKAELYFGAYKSQQQARNFALLQHFFTQFASLTFDDDAAEIAARERARLVTIGRSIGALDLLIAAIALNHQAILVTHNTREFNRIAGLQIEDWEL